MRQRKARPNAKVTDQNLVEILSKHYVWLVTDGKQGKVADLARANLEGLDLSGANLEYALLQGANLKHAHLTNVRLKGARLHSADLESADLEGASLQGANLEGANLKDANLAEANLRGADLEGAYLGGASLIGANLKDANFIGTVLHRARVNGSRRQILEDYSDVPGEAPEGSPLGRFAFPRFRRGLPPEPDTPLEKRLFEALDDHVVRNRKLNAKEAAAIQDLLSKGLYPSVFSPPDSDEIFRGMKVSRPWLAKLLGVASAKDLPKSGEMEVAAIFKPKNGGGSSWTGNISVTDRFSNAEKGERGHVSVTLCAMVKDNPNKLVSGPGHLYNLDYLGTFANEAEVIGLGDIRVHKIIWKPSRKPMRHATVTQEPDAEQAPKSVPTGHYPQWD